MKRYTLIAGPERSGKTTLAIKMAGKRKYQVFGPDQLRNQLRDEFQSTTQVLIIEGVLPKHFERLKSLVTCTYWLIDRQGEKRQYIKPPEIIMTLHPSVDHTKLNFDDDPRVNAIILPVRSSV